MNKIYEIYYIGLSDFLDRVRSKSVFFIVLLMMYISCLFFPENNSSVYYTLDYSINGFFYRGVYNSVWLSWVATIAFISVISLVGFYLVRNSIRRERELLIGEITAATEVTPYIFIFGKAFSGFMFLLLQMLVVILITIIMQFVRGESYSIEPFKLLTPFLILAVPACFITVVMAIIFEVIPFLSSSIGNVVYFFLWAGIMIAGIQKKGDAFGINTTANIILEQLKLNFKEFKDINSFSLGYSGALNGNVKTFVMHKVNIHSYILFGRLFWILIGILLLLLVSMLFRKTSLASSKVNRVISNKKIEEEFKNEDKVTLSEIFEAKSYSNNFSIMKSEFKLILTSLNLWWYAAVFLCSIGVFFGKGEVLYKFLIPALWILPIFLWSKLSVIPMKYNMEEYLLIYRNYRRGRVFASFAAGIVFTILVNTALIIKFAMLSKFLAIVHLLIGAVFVNGLGMFIGNFSKSSTAFEITYIILWYVGILSGLPQLDFLGISERSLNFNISLIFLILGIGSIMLSAVSRYRE